MATFCNLRSKPQYLLLALLLLAAGSFQALSFGSRKSAGVSSTRQIAIAQGFYITDDTDLLNYTDLHDFLPGNVNLPSSVTADSDGNIYGTTTSETGNVWKITNTGHYIDLRDFGGTITNANGLSGPDGLSPAGQVTLDSQGNIYGLNSYGGPYPNEFGGSGGGMIYEITTTGQYLDLHDFGGAVTYANGQPGQDGGFPVSSYVTFDSAGNMYGVALYGGAYGVDVWPTGWITSSDLIGGVVWELTSDGHYIDLHDFGSGTDGSWPSGGIAFDGNGNMYGTAITGGTNTGANSGLGGGMLWEITAKGQYIDVHDFGAGNDGVGPGPLISDAAGNIFGTTGSGGAITSRGGIVFELTAEGQYLDLHDFGGGDDGYEPYSGVTFDSSGNMYGTASEGGPTGGGIAWELTTDGQYIDLHDFLVGDFPGSNIAFDSTGDLFGTTQNGGVYHNGSVWELSYLSLTVSPAAVVGGTPAVPVPSAVIGGASCSGTVALLGPASSDTTVTVSSSSADAVVPSSVTIPAGSLAASFKISTGAVNVPVAVTIQVTLDGLKSHRTLTVNPAHLTGIKVAPVAAIGGTNSALAVYLNGQAGPGGDVMNLTSSSAAATVPATITVAAGATAANVVVRTTAVSAPTPVTFTATFGSATLHASLTVNPAALSGTKAAPTSVMGGSNSAFAVYLNGAAGPGGTVVKLSSNSAAASVPATITVPAGATDANVVVHTVPVSASTLVSITATFGSAKLSSTLTVDSAVLSSEKMAQSSVIGGNPTSFGISLTGAAGPGGSIVSLKSSSSAAVVASSVTIPAGATSANAVVHTAVVSSVTPVTLTATFGSVSVHTTLTVNPAALASVRLGSSSVKGGNTVAFAVYLNGVAGPGGRIVTLSSSSSSASIPSSLTIPEGATAANVKVTTKTVAASTPVTITATLGSATLKTTLTVTP